MSKAGKVFELTWEDIEAIADLKFEEMEQRHNKARHYTEVLKRFKEMKEK